MINQSYFRNRSCMTVVAEGRVFLQTGCKIFPRLSEEIKLLLILHVFFKRSRCYNYFLYLLLFNLVFMTAILPVHSLRFIHFSWLAYHLLLNRKFKPYHFLHLTGVYFYLNSFYTREVEFIWVVYDAFIQAWSNIMCNFIIICIIYSLNISEQRYFMWR